MQPKDYEDSIKDSMKNLIGVKHSIFESLTSIIMQGELYEWNRSVPVGEIHYFEYDLFKNSDDTNIQLLLQLFDKVSETYQTIKNINCIQIKEEEEEEE